MAAETPPFNTVSQDTASATILILCLSIFCLLLNQSTHVCNMEDDQIEHVKTTGHCNRFTRMSTVGQSYCRGTSEIQFTTQWNSIFEHFGLTLKKRLLYRSRCKIRFLKKKPVCDPCALKEDPDWKMSSCEVENQSRCNPECSAVWAHTWSDQGFGIFRVEAELPKVVNGCSDPLLDLADEKVVLWFASLV